MRRVARLGAALALTLASGGCAVAMAPVNGSLFSDVTGPVTATSNAGGNKVGKAVCTTILGLVAQGDCSITAAAKAGGITKITRVDHHSTGILGLTATFTTIVYGD